MAEAALSVARLVSRRKQTPLHDFGTQWHHDRPVEARTSRFESDDTERKRPTHEGCKHRQACSRAWRARARLSGSDSRHGCCGGARSPWNSSALAQRPPLDAWPVATPRSRAALSSTSAHRQGTPPAALIHLRVDLRPLSRPVNSSVPASSLTLLCGNGVAYNHFDETSVDTVESLA